MATRKIVSGMSSLVSDKIERSETLERKDRKAGADITVTIGQKGPHDAASVTMCCTERVTGTRWFLLRSQAWFLLPINSGNGQPIPGMANPGSSRGCPNTNLGTS